MLSGPKTLASNGNFKPNVESDKLNLGCGLNAPEGWLNVDGSFQVGFARRPRLKKLLVRLGVYPRSQAAIRWPANIMRLDLRQPLPFKNGRFSAVYSSHTIEHLFYDDAVVLIAECCRVLKSGGVCRIVVPDLAATVQEYLRSSRDNIADAADQLMDGLLLHSRSREAGLLGLYHRMFAYHQHKWMYDAKSLSKIMSDAGFKDITNPPCHIGRLADLQSIEDSARVLDGAGIVVEGLKP
jgi:SAM-dependent methyltransferase